MTEQHIPANPAKLLYTVDEVAEMLNLGRSKLYNTYLLTGELPSLKLGRRRLIRIEAVHAFVDRLEARANGQPESS
jgi:excisionase family DNA binding protein